MNAKRPYLVHETGGDRQIPLSEETTFGRTSSNTVQLEDHGCSSRHAAIRKEGDAWLLEDLGSTNGTWLNGERLSSPRPLKEGDRIQMGAQMLRIEGLRVITACARCGRDVPPESAFCPGCGLPQRNVAPGGTVVMAPPLPAPKAVSTPAPPPVPAPLPAAAPPPLPRSLPPALPPSLPPALPPQTPLPIAAPPPPFPAPAPVRKKKSGCWLAGCLIALVLLLLAGVAAWFLWSRFFGAKASPMLGKALEFRQEARFDTPAAVASWGNEGVQDRFKELNQELWPAVDPGLGWAFFFETSVVGTGSPVEDRLPVLFYNPWADVALVTLWSGEGRMEDAEVLAGDSLRRRGEAPFGGGRGWMGVGAYGPAAVGGITARTLQGFESTFRGGSWSPSALRKTFPAWSEAANLEAARLACGLQLAQVFQDLVAFSQSGDGTARTAYVEVLTQGAKGEAEALSALASGTPRESAEALKQLPREHWAAFKVTSFADLGDRALVMAHHSELPDLFLGMVLQRDGQGFVPQRLDCLSFNACYEASR